VIATGAVRGGRRLRAASVLLLLAGLLAWGPSPAPAAAAAAASGSPCSDPTGITVVVDFHDLGGGVEVGCAPQPVSSGFEALEKAGFDAKHVESQPAALCNIENQPDRDCRPMPPTSSYWAYWYASRGGAWCYATRGPGNRKPPPGTVEGWAFSQGNTESSARKPDYGPPPAIPGTTPSTVSSTCGSAPTTLPTPITQPPTPVTDPPATDGGDTGGGDSGGDDGGQPTGTTRPRAGGAASTTTTAPLGPDGSVVDPSSTSSPSSSSSTSARDDEQAGGQMRIGDRDEGGGSPVGALVGGSAVALLGAVAAITARRRRRVEGGTS
jgi:hypothetical protein